MAGSPELVDVKEKPMPSTFHHRLPSVFNIKGFLEIFRSFHGIFRGETGDFYNIFGEIPERI